jgi:DNA-binding XRE family transcriptional regulator
VCAASRPDESVPVLFRRARIALSLTQEGLGKLLRVSRKTAGRWEMGKVVPSSSEIRALAGAVHPHDRGLAEQAGETLSSLKLEPPPPARRGHVGSPPPIGGYLEVGESDRRPSQPGFPASVIVHTGMHVPEQQTPAIPEHAAPAPHAHVPAREQLLAVVVLHEWHAFPPSPHSGNVGVTQEAAPAQQFVPIHVDGLQKAVTHEPDWQTKGEPHAAEDPHTHLPASVPSAEPPQPSEVLGLQAAHIWPPYPQDEGQVGASHVLPEQQPIGHDVELQTHVPPEQI